MRFHMVQMEISWEDKAASQARARRLVDGAGVAEGDVVVLPEMFDTGFSLNVDRTADTNGVSRGFLDGLARDTGACVVGGVTLAREDGRGLNRAYVAGPSGVLAEYDKVHPFTYGREGERFVGGERVVVFEWGGARICPVVCYDLRFPELFRAGLTGGAEAFVVIANWPAARAGHWRTLLEARAIENQAAVVGVNRAGRDPHLEYSGGSAAFGAKGEKLAEMGEEEGGAERADERGGSSAVAGGVSGVAGRAAEKAGN